MTVYLCDHPCTLMEYFPGIDFDLVRTSEGQTEDVTNIHKAIERQMDVGPKKIQQWLDCDQKVDACEVMSDEKIVKYLKASVPEEDEEVKCVYSVVGGQLDQCLINHRCHGTIAFGH